MITSEFELHTGTTRVTDITRQVASFVAEAGGDGLVHVFLPHATAGLALIETGAGSDQDLLEVVDRLFPRDDRWQHAHGSPGHGADHVMPAVIAPSVTVPAQDGRLLLGTWQSIVVVDPNVDNPRRRVRVSILRG